MPVDLSDWDSGFKVWCPKHKCVVSGEPMIDPINIRQGLWGLDTSEMWCEKEQTEGAPENEDEFCNNYWEFR